MFNKKLQILKEEFSEIALEQDNLERNLFRLEQQKQITKDEEELELINDEIEYIEDILDFVESQKEEVLREIEQVQGQIENLQKETEKQNRETELSFSSRMSRATRQSPASKTLPILTKDPGVQRSSSQVTKTLPSARKDVLAKAAVLSQRAPPPSMTLSTPPPLPQRAMDLLGMEDFNVPGDIEMPAVPSVPSRQTQIIQQIPRQTQPVPFRVRKTQRKTLAERFPGQDVTSDPGLKSEKIQITVDNSPKKEKETGSKTRVIQVVVGSRKKDGSIVGPRTKTSRISWAHMTMEKKRDFLQTQRKRDKAAKAKKQGSFLSVEDVYGIQQTKKGFKITNVDKSLAPNRQQFREAPARLAEAELKEQRTKLAKLNYQRKLAGLKPIPDPSRIGIQRGQAEKKVFVNNLTKKILESGKHINQEEREKKKLAIENAIPQNIRSQIEQNKKQLPAIRQQIERDYPKDQQITVDVNIKDKFGRVVRTEQKTVNARKYYMAKQLQKLILEPRRQAIKQAKEAGTLKITPKNTPKITAARVKNALIKSGAMDAQTTMSRLAVLVVKFLGPRSVGDLAEFHNRFYKNRKKIDEQEALDFLMMKLAAFIELSPPNMRKKWNTVDNASLRSALSDKTFLEFISQDSQNLKRR